MRAIKRFGNRGFTLVELMIVVAIIGVLAALAIYGVRRYLASSKTAEAKNTIGAISRSAVSAYERESYSNELIPDGQSSTSFVHQLCGNAASWVPTSPPQAKKYQPSTGDNADFNTGDTVNGWKCLRFSMSEPTYYSYHYATGANITGSGATTNGFEAAAQGDLDGNSKNSMFVRGADVRNGTVVLSTEIFIQNEYE
jgi:type IV pilus assembly protein PilA